MSSCSLDIFPLELCALNHQTESRGSCFFFFLFLARFSLLRKHPPTFKIKLECLLFYTAFPFLAAPGILTCIIF